MDPIAKPTPSPEEPIDPRHAALYELARQQGITEPQRFEDLLGTPWTVEEGGEEDFEAWLRELRRRPDREREWPE